MPDSCSASKLSCLRLSITCAERALKFYRDQLGMRLIEQSRVNNNKILRLGFEGDQSASILELMIDQPGNVNNAQHNSGYWKIAIAVADLDNTYQCLMDRGVDVSTPFEVPDVAYLCHAQDPDGYCIEFIQHRFVRNHQAQVIDSSCALGSKAVFSLITLKIKDPKTSLDFYQNQLGLRLISRQQVTDRGFTLYFLSADNEHPPCNDIDDIPLREWLWQRPYTLLELQHVHGTELDPGFAYCSNRTTGLHFIGVVLKDEPSNGRISHITDPDGYRLELRYA